MRVSSKLGLFILALCLASPGYAALTVNDLPYIQGTPLAEDAWEIQDYAEDSDGIHWVWLHQGASSAYIIYPSAEAVQLPDNVVVAANDDEMTLRLLGDADQEWLFTRFGSALFTLIGNDVTVQYTAVAANNADGSYPGDLHMDAREIHMEGELTLAGSMELNAEETVGLYGSLRVVADLWIAADIGLIIGSVENNGTVLDACNSGYFGNLTSVHIETSFATKGCQGDLVISPDLKNLDITPPTIQTEQVTVQSAPQKPSRSKGGSISWWLIGLLALIARPLRLAR